jgi:hypothetical protein
LWKIEKLIQPAYRRKRKRLANGIFQSSTSWKACRKEHAEITLPDEESALSLGENVPSLVENELTEENFEKFFLLPSQNLIKLGVKIKKELLERSKTKLLRTCPGEGC